jgi:hypothetical protein
MKLMTRKFTTPAALLAALWIIGSTPSDAQERPDPVFAEWREQADPAIERALGYLASVQKRDGSFPENFGDSTGIPALVGMAFLSKGHLPTEGPYAEALTRCIDFVLNNQRSQGLFEKGHAGSGPMYAHNISTLFISEVSGMVDPERQERIERALPRALELILQAQAVPKSERHQGGWRYHPGSSDSDTSCSGWALMALRSAKLNGAAVPDAAIEAAVSYLKRHQHEQYGCFGYTGTEDHARSLTGMGLLCLELSGLHGTPETIKAADYVMKTFRQLRGDQFEFYGNYYNAQGTFQIGGNYWSEYGPWMYETYLKEQNPDGSWDSREAGRIYGTAIMALSFTVPYRQLPIYQRDETVDELAP